MRRITAGKASGYFAGYTFRYSGIEAWKTSAEANVFFPCALAREPESHGKVAKQVGGHEGFRAETGAGSIPG